MSGDKLVNVNAPTLCEVQIRWDSKVIWVNVDGVCLLRVSNIEQLQIIDQRQRATTTESDNREDG